LLDGAGRGEIYDPFNYDFVEENPGEGTTIPTWYSNVWATIVVATIARVASVISLGHNANAMTIPGGNPNTFDLKFRAFIPPAWVRGPDPCLLVDNSGNLYVANWTIYGGDNRGFDPFSRNYRAHAEGVVSTLTGTWQGGTVYGSGRNPYYDAGITTRYAGDALAPDGFTLYSDYVYHDCHYTDNVFKEDNSHMSGSAQGGSGSVTVNFYGDVNDQISDLGQNTPGLGYNVTYIIATNSNPAIPAYSFNYSHKCYPAYEAYIGTQQIYGYRPLSNNPFYISGCLFGGLIITGSTVGAVQ
jgi:hypothetical protein